VEILKDILIVYLIILLSVAVMTVIVKIIKNK